MATTSDVKLQIAGIGHVYRAPVGTAPFSLDGYQFNGGAAQGGAAGTSNPVGGEVSDDAVAQRMRELRGE